MDAPDPVVLREALRQGERILAWQDSLRESILRRTGELLRLAVATLGGILVLAGLMASSSTSLTGSAYWGFGAGVTFEALSAGTLASALAGGRWAGDFGYGPDLGRVMGYVLEGSVDEVGMLATMAGVQPDWILDNNRLLVRLQRINGIAVSFLILGAAAILVTLGFIGGGVMSS